MKKILLAAIILFIMSGFAFADVVTESEEYQLMMEYKALYNEAYAEGDYELALEYAEKVREYSILVNELAAAELARLQNLQNNTDNTDNTDVTDNTDNTEQTGPTEEELLALQEQLRQQHAELLVLLALLELQDIDPSLNEAWLAALEDINDLLADLDRLEAAEAALAAAAERLAQLEAAIAENIRRLDQLLAMAEEDLYEAEKVDGYLHAEADIYEASALFFTGYLSIKNMALEQAESELNRSRFYSEQAYSKSRAVGQWVEVDAMLFATAEIISDASRTLVQDEDGTISWVAPWGPETFLYSHPLTEPTFPEKTYQEAESMLYPLPQPDYMPMAETDDMDNDETMEESMDGDEMTAEEDMEADVVEMTSLDTAVDLWEKGVISRNSGDLELAEEYFQQSQNFAQSAGMEKVSFPFEITASYDTLWDISRKIYGVSWLWPLIYMENMETIDDPDEVYPGQEITIPSP